MSSAGAEVRTSQDAAARFERAAGLDATSRSRYDRQMRFAPIGTEGQRRLGDAAVLVAGVGALGCSLAQQMARAGVGFIRLADRDFVEPDNLHRQTLFDEDDAATSAPKAVAAAARLRRLNSEARIEPHVAEINAANVAALISGTDLVLDGTDNVETRLLLSDACFSRGIPFVYGGATGSSASAAALVPGETACLRCLIGEPGDTEPGDTCDTAGIIGPAVELAASLQAAEALKWLSGNREAMRRTWITADVWQFALRETKLPPGRSGCPYCGGAGGAQEAASSGRESRARAGWAEPSQTVTGGMDGARLQAHLSEPDRELNHMVATVLCGRGTVQVATGRETAPAHCADRLAGLGCEIVASNAYLVRARTPSGASLAVFGDGRALVRGVETPAEALELCRYYLMDKSP
ncbi:ThiF family adenylyltransferase [Cohnella sp. 56]|uniref:ThiF family adenylyltransferase n=1 Tax=Cohnella sp. 56 TaxID=3113722 RepID=UPI0030E84660